MAASKPTLLISIGKIIIIVEWINVRIIYVVSYHRLDAKRFIIETIVPFVKLISTHKLVRIYSIARVI